MGAARALDVTGPFENAGTVLRQFLQPLKGHDFHRGMDAAHGGGGGGAFMPLCLVC